MAGGKYQAALFHKYLGKYDTAVRAALAVSRHLSSGEPGWEPPAVTEVDGLVLHLSRRSPTGELHEAATHTLGYILLRVGHTR